jgi:DNA-binding CsgD family transcriptional regulator
MTQHIDADLDVRAGIVAWIRSNLREAIPHQSALVLRGSAHSLGFTIDDSTCVDVPQGYLAVVLSPSGRIHCPVSSRWFQSRTPQYLDANCAPDDIDRTWLQSFRIHGLRNCALYGYVDERAGRLTLLSLYNTPGPHEFATREEGTLVAQHLHEMLATAKGCGVAREGGLHLLTRAELAVLRWLGAGRTNKEIGKILCKSEFTVKTHVQRMLEKTGLDNRLQLSKLAHSIGDDTAGLLVA